MSSDNSNVTVQIVENGMITIPIEDYNLLLEHDTRLQILRDKVEHSIDTDQPMLCTEMFLRALLGLLDYEAVKKPKAEAEDE